jgi:hypothetical protein
MSDPQAQSEDLFAIDVTTLSPVAQKLLDPGGPPPLRNLAARAIAPGLKPNEALTVCVVLSFGSDALGESARKTLEKLPLPVLNGALGSAELHPGALHALAPFYAKDPEIAQRVLMHPSLHDLTVAELAKHASEPVAELISTNEERLLRCPEIIERLYTNKATRMSTADRMIELAARNNLQLNIAGFAQALAAIQGELLTEPSEERTYDDVVFAKAEEIAAKDTAIDEDTHEVDEATGEEKVKATAVERVLTFQELNTSAKVRRALLGDAKDRLLAVRDPNPIVREAAIKAPGMNENEITRISANRNTAEDVLRIIASDRDWTRAYQVKLNLASNPRTPFVFGSRLVSFLRESDLKKLEKSRDVSGAIQNAVKQHLSRKNK